MARDEIIGVVQRLAARVLGIDVESTSRASRLVELGANSIDRMEIVTLAMQELNVKCPLVELGVVSDIESLATLLYEKQSRERN